MAHTLCTFNVNNLFVRYRFGKTFPGDVSKKSAVTNPDEGYLPMYSKGAFELFNPVQRELAAQAISAGSQGPPDILCLQEVESLIALRTFNEEELKSHYKYAVLVDSRDFRQIDVGILTNLEILGVRTHVDDKDPQAPNPKIDPWQFSRDCLEVELALNKSGTRRLALFINHFKSKFVDPRKAKTPKQKAAARAKDDAYRKRQAQAVRRIVRERFPAQEFDRALFAVIGDLNDEADSDPLRPIVKQAGLVNALERIPAPVDRWTNWFRSQNSVSEIDHILFSPALDKATQGSIPYIERRGISFKGTLAGGGISPKQTRFYRVDNDPAPVSVDFGFKRFSGVTPKDYASDHCPVFVVVP